MKKYISLEEMKNVNCSSVLNVIRNCGEVSRKQITDITGLSWGGMTKIVNTLFEQGYIEEAKSEKVSGVKRTPNVIRVCKEDHFVIGLDINRMGFGAYVMNLAGDIIKEYFSECSFQNKEELLRAILGFVRQIMETFSDKKMLAIGVAMQGALDVDNGISIKFPHCPDWKMIPIKKILEEEFGIDVFIEHDPDCMLYSSLHEEESENILLLRMDNSVGMAAAVNGGIIRGNGLLEVAHCIVMPQGKECRCGQKGCLEAYISPCLDKERLNKTAIEEMIEPLAIFINNMVCLFNSDTIILTGKLAKYRENFEGELCEKIYQFYDREEIWVKIVEEEERAVYGAALIAVEGAIGKLRI